MIIKKRSIVICSVVVAVIFTFIMCLCALYAVPIKSVETDNIRIVLDAGHGGKDGGVIGAVTKVKESTINLAVTKKLQQYLEVAGFSVFLTRNSEAGLYGVATKNLKKKDMAKRKEIIESVKPNIVVSIHMNSYPVSSRRGGQVFYKQGDENSKVLAKSIQENFNLLEESLRDCNILSGDYYILNCSEYTSVIAECGFLSNPEEEKLLIQDEYQDKIAYSIFKGIIKYFSEMSFREYDIEL